MRRFASIVIGCGLCTISQAQTPQIWLDYEEDKENGVTPELLDYSFAGYRFSEEPIPSVDTWQQFSVTDYGAVADDEGYDDDAIQATIVAAEAHDGSAVVYFPAGKYRVSPDNDTNKSIRISRNSIVLKGAGADAGGTEIFMDKRRVKNGHWQFVFEPNSSPASGSTTILGAVEKGAFSVVVDDASGFVVGEVILITHKSTAFAEAHFEGLDLNEQEWTRLFGLGGGMSLHELHEIAAINGTRITFKNPVQTYLPELELKFTITHYQVIEEVGVEDILFTSDWVNYPEDFFHHKDDIHDYAWNAVQFENVRNAWLRNCEFNSWNQVVEVRESIGVTVENVVISGKKGHASFLTRRGYGLLVKDCDDQAGQHHGPGTGYSGVNTVYVRCKMKEDQSVDSHSGQPYATLMDDIDGGVMNRNGGPYESYPHHGRDLTFWNFIHKSSETVTYDFWNSTGRNGNTYALPNFIGFQPNATVNTFDLGIDQMEGQRVSPASLFEAQLELRIIDAATKPVIDWLSPNFGEQLDIGDNMIIGIEASDPDGTIEKVVLYINNVKQRELTSVPYQWGVDQGEDPDLFDLEGGTYWLKVETYDDGLNVTRDSIKIFVGQAPKVDFVSPSQEHIHESGKQLAVEASASDQDGTISSVALYLDGKKINELAASPYQWASLTELKSIESGTHILGIAATDNDGLTTLEEQEVVVNDFPVITFDLPMADQNFEAGSHVEIVVNATDADGTIEQVLLQINGDLQRKETVVPYAWGERSDLDPDLFDMQAGTYELEAVAIDNIGSESLANLQFSITSEAETLGIDVPVCSVYPNPFSNQMTIRSKTEITKVKLLDLTGRQMIERYYDGKHTVALKTEEVSSGFYILQVDLLNSRSEIIEIIKD